MLRIAGIACGLLALFLAVEGGAAADKKATKNQMVKGTVKTVDTEKDVLVVNQKVKNEVVDRELSILNTTEFQVTLKSGETKSAAGRDGLRLLEGLEGASIAIKCDKDVNVLSVKAKAK